MSILLVVNSGSSSIKYQLFEMEREEVLAKGLVERVGAASGTITHTGPGGQQRADVPVPDHDAGFRAMVDACAEWGPSLDEVPVVAVGHRVVQGGARFVVPTVIDDDVESEIEQLSPLAPLHNPPNLRGIRAARRAFPRVPHVAVFDTAFHRTLPEEAFTYAIDAEIARTHGIRRYGFHGTSHQYVSAQAAEFLGRPTDEVNSIILHLGNGASACAVRGGVSVDTSMGMTPLEGLVMGTRSGDLDPGILLHLHREAGLTVAELDQLLNRRSGLLGLTGSGDMRDVLAAAARGEPGAGLALAVTCHRLKGYVGAYLAILGRVDTIVFTAGIGENAPEIRSRALAGLDDLGIRIDPARNESDERGARRISADSSGIAVLVIPTNEELEIARQTQAALADR